MNIDIRLPFIGSILAMLAIAAVFVMSLFWVQIGNL